MMRRTLIATTMALATTAASGVALAGDAATAEALFRQGRQLMDKGDFAAACPRLAESFAQDPATGTLLALAMCQEKAGQTASAWATYSDVVARAKRDGRADRESAARERMQALEPQLSRLSIEVDATAAAVAGLTVTRDGVAVGKGAWGTPTPVDPGDHVIEASAPGRRPWKATVKVGASADSQVATVPPLEAEAGAPAPGPVPAASATVATGGPAATDAGPSGGTLRTVGLVVGGVGLVTLGVSGYFGLHAKSLNSDSERAGHCDANNTCDAAGLEKRNDAVSASQVATVTLIAGGVLAAAGVTLFVVGGPKEGGPPAARVQATPLVGWGTAGLAAQGSF